MDKLNEKRRKWLSVISVGIVLVLAGFLTWFVWNWLSSFSQDGFRDYIRSFGAWGWAVLLGLQFLQVFVALIPGELLETAAGYAFGPLVGTLICYVGIASASAVIFSLVKRFGVRVVDLFFDRNKINELRFINTAQKRNNLLFVLFFIPGTPKDLLTYFVGLTDVRLGTFLVISLVARIPSVISSTVGGHLLGEERYLSAVILYGVTGAVSLMGLWIYNRMVKRRSENDNSL